MHTVDIWSRVSRNTTEWSPTPVQEPQIALGYAGAKALRIIPQVDGKGLGLTILDMKDRKLMEIDIDPVTGVASYRVIIRNWAAGRTTDGRWELLRKAKLRLRKKGA